tara:strand:+ start:3394 stop:4005 length:612 start_codon:yes stop_codon:yes gene_type:complete
MVKIMQMVKNNINTNIWQNAIYPYWVFENVIDEDTCHKIINLGKNKWIEGKVGDKKEIDTKTRRTDVAWSNDDWLYNICWGYLHNANRNANWNFEISSCEPMQITKYKKNGHYEFHQDGNGFTRFDVPDNKILHGKTRKLSMTIILNEDYEGGEFEFFDDKNLIKEKKGTIIVFPSYMVHKVRPVTKGIRYSLVAWFCGEPFV